MASKTTTNQISNGRATLVSANDIHQSIAAIIEKQRVSAERSAYDRKVCILAVSTASRTWREIEVEGSPSTYLQSVLKALETLRDTYYDEDGEYTSGSSEIGSIVAKVERLQADLFGSPHSR